MVHPALLNADIVSMMCESLHRQSLSALARTARFLQDPALRELWRVTKKFSHLLSLFGSSMHYNQGTIYLSDDLTSAQWDRFKFYAQYVRTLWISEEDTIELSSLRMLLPHQPLLPHLRSLDVDSESWSGEGYYSCLSMFIVASIQRFAIAVDYCEDSSALEHFIMALGTTAPALRNLEISTSEPIHGWDSWEVGNSIFCFHNLHSIDIPLTGLQVHSILSHLSTLPSLSRMRFNITDLARASTTGSKYAFLTIRELSIDSESDKQLMDFIMLTSFDNLTNLSISCDNFQMDSDALFKAIFPSCSQSLNQISISGGTEGIEPIKFPSLYPLFKFANLRSFSFSISETLGPTDGDVQDIAKSWPNLEEFCVDPYFDYDTHSSPLTLTGLLLLIEQCTKLMKISTAVNARHVPTVTSSIRRPGLVIHIEPFFSPADCPKSLADFLSLALPDADIKLFDDGRKHEIWEEAFRLRQDFIKARQAGEKHQAEMGTTDV